MDWKNVQLPLFDPVHLGNTTFDINGPTYQVKGFELQFVARLTEGFTLQGSSSVNSPSRPTRPACRAIASPAGNPTPLGQCITQVKGMPYTNPYGVLGTRPPFSPPWMFNVRARYDWTCGDYKPFAWVGASHIGRRATSRRASRTATTSGLRSRRPRRCCATRSRATRPMTPRSAWPRTTGRAVLLASNLEQRVRPVEHLLGTVHQVRDPAAAARADVPVRVQVLTGKRSRPTACGSAGLKSRADRMVRPFFGAHGMPLPPPPPPATMTAAVARLRALLREAALRRGARGGPGAAGSAPAQRDALLCDGHRPALSSAGFPTP